MVSGVFEDFGTHVLEFVLEIRHELPIIFLHIRSKFLLVCPVHCNAGTEF